jgi:hypothetical protein
MKKCLILGVVTVTTVSIAIAAVEPEFSADRIRAHVAFLADDTLEGREAGTRGHEIAARYVASQFALLGVKPGGQNGQYFQKVDLFESARTGPVPTVALTTPRGTQTLKHRGAVLVRGPIAGGAVNLSAQLVFVGYGIKDSGLGYDDYKGLDVQGKIAVVLLGSPKGMDSEVGAHLLSEQSRVAAGQGAVGIISLQTRVTAAAFPWRQLIELQEDFATTWIRSDGTPFDPSYGLKAAAADRARGCGITLRRGSDVTGACPG